MSLPQGKAKDEGTHKEAERVIKVVELKGPLARDLLRVCPASPAQHAERHEKERHGIRSRYEQRHSLWNIT